MNARLQRGRLLFMQDRWELAERELRRALAEDPEDAQALALLAQAVSEQGRHDEAMKLAREAVGRRPDDSYTHVALARVLMEAGKKREALAAADEALRIDPDDETNWGLKSSLLGQNDRWAEALEAAEAGLAIDAEDDTCRNMRALCLQQLGRREEAEAAAEEALEADPDSALAHATRGWAYVRSGDQRRAEEHFREALRLDPNLDWAREGVLTALKARNPIYGAILKYFLWMGSLPPGVRWGVIIGIYICYRVLRSISRTTPEARPIVVPIIVLLAGFVLLTWIADPLFNLFLRLHPFGRLALTRRERAASNVVGLIVLGALVSLGGWFVTGNGWWGMGAIGLTLYMIAVAGSFAPEQPQARRRLGLMTIVLGIAGVGAAVCGLTGQEKAAASLAAVYFLGIFAFTILANIAISRE